MEADLVLALLHQFIGIKNNALRYRYEWNLPTMNEVEHNKKGVVKNYVVRTILVVNTLFLAFQMKIGRFSGSSLVI